MYDFLFSLTGKNVEYAHFGTKQALLVCAKYLKTGQNKRKLAQNKKFLTGKIIKKYGENKNSHRYFKHEIRFYSFI